MNLPSWIPVGLRKRLFPRLPETPDLRLRVFNLHRQTTLATSLEVADSGPKRNKGLLGRDRLARGEGLWIVPCEAVHTFGMRFSIDLVYLDREKRIIKLRRDVHPWRLSACIFAHSVIELPAGTIRDTQTELGDELKFLSAPLTVEDLLSQG
jgi:hypothetical protein